MKTTTRRHALHLLAAARGGHPARPGQQSQCPRQPWRSERPELRLLQGLDRSHGKRRLCRQSPRRGQQRRVRAKLGLPQRLGSCHTALVGGYLIEGHVPAADVHKLLKEKPKALGITVPGMPIGSPGMDGPEYNGRKDPYDVLLVTKNLMNSDVSTRVFTSYLKRGAIFDAAAVR